MRILIAVLTIVSPPPSSVLTYENEQEFMRMCHAALEGSMNPWDGLFQRTAISLHGAYSVGPNEILIIGDQYAQEMERGYEIGHVDVQGLTVSFTPKKKLSLVNVEPVLSYVLIPWGARLYLVDARCVVEFCNDVNAGIYPHGTSVRPIFLHSGTRNVEPTGKPEVPVEYRHYLLSTPLRCAITSVGDWETDVTVTEIPYTRFRGFRCRIDAGARQGAFPGMTLFTQRDFEPLLLQTIVVAVRENDSDVVVEPLEHKKELLIAGIQFSSRKPPNYATIKTLATPSTRTRQHAMSKGRCCDCRCHRLRILK